MFHLAANFQQSPGSFHVHFDGDFQFFIKPYGGCGIEHDGNMVDDKLQIRWRKSKHRKGDVSF